MTTPGLDGPGRPRGREADRDDRGDGAGGTADPYRWMSCVAAARQLGLPLRALYRSIDRGEIPAYRIDGQIRLRYHEVARCGRGGPEAEDEGSAGQGWGVDSVDPS